MSTESPILVGEVVKAHGTAGEVVIAVHTERLGRFDAGESLWCGLNEDNLRTIEIATSRTHQDRILVRFSGISDRTSAESMRGQKLFVMSNELEKPEVDGYWEHELIGLEVFDVTGKPLGHITEVHVREAQDLWGVSHGEKTVLVPAVPALVKEVDVVQGRVVVDPPAGLFEE